MLLRVLILLKTAAVIISIGFKVSEKFPTNIESCFLKTVTLRSARPEFGCVIACKNTPMCFLACAKENGECRLYSANVSPWWAGIESANEGTIDSICYSTWTERPDLISSSLAIASSGLFAYSRLEDITGGYSCPSFDTVIYMYHSTFSDNPWVLIDLQAQYLVKKIIFQVRRSANYGILFGKVEVRIGNFNDPQNFAKNSLLMYFDRDATSGEIVTFEQEKALYGRYVSVQSFVKSSYLAFKQMKIIPQI